nr:NAD(P)H-quinone oxidoreductase [Paenactinomyces guangxiensis]
MVTEPGGAEKLYMGEYPKPSCQPGEILVKVKATALNRADILQREGKYPPPPGASPVMGLEIAGVVEEVGEQFTGVWHPGDRVFGLLPGGGYAEYAVIPGEMAIPVPDSFTFAQAAAIPEVFLTAYQALFWVGKLQKGETVLIHAGASGVGTAAIQLAKAVGANPIVTVGSDEKREACQKLGASFAFNYKEGPFTEKVKNATNGAGVDLILDFVGAPYWDSNLALLKVDGRFVLISTLGGSRVESVSLGQILAKRLQITGTTLRSRPLDYKIRLTKEFSSFALPRFKNGELHPVIDQIFSWTEVQKAHRYMEWNQNIGKIILTIE